MRIMPFTLETDPENDVFQSHQSLKSGVGSILYLYQMFEECVLKVIKPELIRQTNSNDFALIFFKCASSLVQVFNPTRIPLLRKLPCCAHTLIYLITMLSVVAFDAFMIRGNKLYAHIIILPQSKPLYLWGIKD